MKPGIGTYDRFKRMFERSTRKRRARTYLIPYFIAAHPGTTDEDMLSLALWLKANGFRADQVQAFYPLANGHHRDVPQRQEPAAQVTYRARVTDIVKSEEQRRLHKAFLRYHDPKGYGRSCARL